MALIPPDLLDRIRRLEEAIRELRGHAGLGDPHVLAAVTAENYGATPAHPVQNTVDGNARFYGFECINLGDGKDPWPQAQLDAIERVSAAICRAHGWTAKSVIGHKEWQTPRSTHAASTCRTCAPASPTASTGSRAAAPAAAGPSAGASSSR